jgi:hypothetical protein
LPRDFWQSAQFGLNDIFRAGDGPAPKELIGAPMCGSSAGFLFAIVSRLVNREARVLDTPVTDTGDTAHETRIRRPVSRLWNTNF